VNPVPLNELNLFFIVNEDSTTAFQHTIRHLESLAGKYPDATLLHLEMVNTQSVVKETIRPRVGFLAICHTKEPGNE
jgi:hypothetical protein